MSYNRRAEFSIGCVPEGRSSDQAISRNHLSGEVRTMSRQATDRTPRIQAVVALSLMVTGLALIASHARFIARLCRSQEQAQPRP